MSNKNINIVELANLQVRNDNFKELDVFNNTRNELLKLYKI